MKSEIEEYGTAEFDRYFNYVWMVVIEPTIENVRKEMDEDFVKASKLCRSYSDMNKYKEDCRKFYREKREWLKDVYLPHESHPKLDQHKLGALWCRTLLAYKPFYFNSHRAKSFVRQKFDTADNETIDFSPSVDNSEWFCRNIYANYRAAFLVSLGILYLYLLFDSKLSSQKSVRYLDEDSFSYFQAIGKLRCPPAGESHSSFSSSCIIALEKNDVTGRDFDYLMYAMVLYQIEHYNKLCYYMQRHGLDFYPHKNAPTGNPQN